jgi:hypothetical protein
MSMASMPVRFPNLPENLGRDPGWRSAWHILTSSTFRPGDARLWGNVDLQHEDIWFDRILANGTWSGTEHLMLEAAHSLFNGDTKVSLYRLMNRLSDDQAVTLIEAMCLLARLPIRRAP